MGERFLAPLMRRFALQHPRLSVVVDLTNRLVDLVSEGYDLAIRTGTLADARLIRTRIASRQFLTCAAPGYQIGRAHVCTPVTNAHLVCRLLLEKTKIDRINGIDSKQEDKNLRMYTKVRI